MRKYINKYMIVRNCFERNKYVVKVISVDEREENYFEIKCKICTGNIRGEIIKIVRNKRWSPELGISKYVYDNLALAVLNIENSERAILVDNKYLVKRKKRVVKECKKP